tara:strand:+ start:318 stop:500 length:183 start_codon:yes stop_codon:yes gene_type:complete
MTSIMIQILFYSCSFVQNLQGYTLVEQVDVDGVSFFRLKKYICNPKIIVLKPIFSMLAVL